MVYCVNKGFLDSKGRLLNSLLYITIYAFKVQMKCFFFITEFERATKIRKIAVYHFLISLLAPVNGLKKSSFRSKSSQKRRQNQSKSIKFVTSCAGHVDGFKNE